uniref:Nipped-B protein n=1 Tax=Parastrongyloides trichosuri TaxID=131310 RepID=A0A0N4ZMU3_PARTI
MFSEVIEGYDDDTMDVDFENKENDDNLENIKIDPNKKNEQAWSSLVLSETEALNDVQEIITEWKKFNENEGMIWDLESKLNQTILYNLSQEFNILYGLKKIGNIQHSFLEFIMKTISEFPSDMSSTFDLINFSNNFQQTTLYCSRFIDISCIGLQIVTSRVGLKLNNEEFLETVFDYFLKLTYKIDEECKSCELKKEKEINLLKGKLFNIFEMYGSFFKQARGYVGFASKVLNNLSYMFLNIFENSFKLPIIKCLISIFKNSEDQCQILTELILHSTVAAQFENETIKDGESNFTVLLISLVQCVFYSDDIEYDYDDDVDNSVNELLVRFSRSEKLIDVITTTFLIKMKQRDMEKIERLAMLRFVKELIKILFKPEWPAAERFLISLATKLSYNFLQSGNDIVVRNACIEISAELCKMMIREHMYDLDKFQDIFSKKLDEIKNRQFESLSLKRKKLLKYLKVGPLQYCLYSTVVTDYLNISYNDQSVYNCKISKYYHIAECLDFINKEYENNSENNTVNEKAKKKIKKMVDNMKTYFVWNLKNLYVYNEIGDYLGMTKSEIEMANKMMVVQRELNGYVSNFFKVVVACLRKEIPLQLRVTTTKCLSSIFELNYDLINIPLLIPFITFRALDLSPQSREVHISFLGKCISTRPDLMKKYFSVFYGRLNDQNVSVRKAVLSILPSIIPMMDDSLKIEVVKDIIMMSKDESTIFKEIINFFKDRWFQESYQYNIPENIFNEIKTIASQCSNDEKSIEFNKIIVGLEEIDCVLIQKVMKQFVTYFWNQIQTNYEKNDVSSISECLSALKLISKVLPDLFVDFIDLTLPYIQLFNNNELLQKNILDLVKIILNTISSLKIALNKVTMDSIEKSLCNLLLIKDYNLWEISIKTLAKMNQLWHTKTDRPVKLVEKYVEEFGKHVNSNDNLRIMIYHYGLFVRYYHILFFRRCKYFEEIRNEEFLKQKVISILFKFTKNCNDPLMMKTIVKSLSECLIGHPKYFIEPKVVLFLKQFLVGNCQNCSIILKAIHEAIKNDEKILEIKSKADRDLKVLNLEEDSLPFKIMNIYYPMVLNIYYSVDTNIRIDCYKIISLNLSTGIISPHESIRYMVASLCDSKLSIYNEVYGLLLNIERKSPKSFLPFIIEGMVQGFKLLNGKEDNIHGFFEKNDKNKKIKKTTRSTEVCSYFNVIYKFILKYKYYKNSFFQKIISEIAIVSKDISIIKEKMFIIDSIATLNFKETESIVYIIEKCGSTIDISGAEYLKFINNILETNKEFKESLEDIYTPNQVLIVLKSLNENDISKLVDYVLESYSFILLSELRNYLQKRFNTKDFEDGSVEVYGLKEYDIPVINYKHIFDFQMPLLDGALRTLSEYICYFHSSVYELE